MKTIKVGDTNCVRKRKEFSEPDKPFITSNINESEVKVFSSEELSLINDEKLFSAASIKDRVKLLKLPPKIRFARILRDYSIYYNSQKNSLKSDEYKILQEMFIADVMSVMNSLSQPLIDGGNLMGLLGLSIASKEVKESGRKLSPIYVKSLRAESTLGDVPKNVYVQLTDLFAQFITSLKTFVFSEESTNLQFADKNLEP